MQRLRKKISQRTNGHVHEVLPEILNRGKERRARQKSRLVSRTCLSIVEDLDASYRSGVRTVGRSVGLHAESFVTRSTYSGQRPTPQALPASLSFSLFSFLLSSQRSRSLLLSPYLSTTRHCVLPQQNPVYSLTLWIFRKRFAAPRASPLSRRAFFKVCVISQEPNFPSAEIILKVSPIVY